MRRFLIFVTPWLPFFVLWVLIVRIQGAPTLRAAVGWASQAIGAAALLSIPVRKLCERLPWPSRLGYVFVLRHILAASAYSLIWGLSLYAYDAVVIRRGILELIAASQVLGWQFLMGLLLYGIIAGVTYTTNLRRHAEEHQRRAAEAESKAAAARLEAIRARLHPHFLFNALHSLGVLVRSDPAAAEVAVESLGQLLRQALSRDDRSLLPMDEEWSFSRKYLEFERIRYGDRLSVSTSIDDEALECLVPPFALQSLIENAVRHAVAVTEGGRIEVRANVMTDRLTIEVEDQGAPAKVERQPHGQQFGLAALRERVANLYGQAAHLETRNLAAGGFLVRLSLPARKIDEVEPGVADAEAPA
ncbi:MAG: sensor histidine kinase [Tepidiformaceae bacterium]